MPIAAVRSSIDAPSYPFCQNTSRAQSSALSTSNARGRPRVARAFAAPRGALRRVVGPLIFIPIDTLFRLTLQIHGLYLYRSVQNPQRERKANMSRKLEGKVALVTGASKGIGASIALHLAAEGAAVVVNYSSSKEGADRIVGEIVGNGGRAIAVQANVAKEADVRRLFAESKKAFGRVDVLVNNAGIYEFKPLEEVTA